MAKITGTSNPYLKQLIRELKRLSLKEKTALWRATALNLEKPTRKRRSINLVKIEKYAKDQETILVPGKVLGSGALDHSVVVAAFNFSTGARALIENAKGKCLTIQELIKQNPKGKNVRVIG